MPPTPEELQAQLTQYQVLELLGHGGMGAVYKGWQNSLERHVAIKVLPPALTEEDEQFTARFKHEAKTMARLSHPAIVSVHDYGETPDGLCYIVMEFIEGTDVQKMMADQGRLPPEHALAIAMNVCDALAYAHEHGIIHRDIKPANVMVDTQGRVMVADFGLAKATDVGATMLTGTNVAVGTPGYIAPETLIMGMGVDARADLYAAGVMLYAMLTGRVPQGRFDAASVRVPGLDPRFDDIVNRAMQQEREARYSSAVELRADLSTILTVPEEAANAQFAKAASSAQLQKSQAAPASPDAPRARPPWRSSASLRWRFAPLDCKCGSRGRRATAAKRQTPGLKAQVPRKSQARRFKATQRSLQTKPAASGSRESPWRPQVSRRQPPAHACQRRQPKQLRGTNSACSPQRSQSNQRACSAAVTNGTLTRQAWSMVAQAHSGAAGPDAEDRARQQPSQSPLLRLPSELATLDTQFQKLQVERVAAPFEAEVAKLNASYLGGLDREIEKEKAAGHLDGILALEDGKKAHPREATHAEPRRRGMPPTRRQRMW